MQLFLSLEHVEVINWPNFNIAVSQGIGMPAGGEGRNEGTAGWWSSQNTHKVYQVLCFICGTWSPQQLQ